MDGRCCLPSSGSRRNGRTCRRRRLTGRRGVVGAGGAGGCDVAGAVGGDVAGAVGGGGGVAGAGGDVAGTVGSDVVAGTVGGGVCTGSRSAADLGCGRVGGSPPAQCSIPSSCPPDLSKIREPLKFKKVKKIQYNKEANSPVLWIRISVKFLRIQIQLFLSQCRSGSTFI
jgi:hypothetical protein